MAWYDDYLEAWSSHDGQRITSFMTPDVTYTDVALGETHSGRTDVAAWIDTMVDEFSTDYAMESVFGFSSDSVYAIEWVLKGTNDGGKVFPATGKPFAIHGVSVGELDNGLIRRNTDYWSLGEFLMQVGLMQAPQAAPAGA
ncbi:MAG: nuclear transport factor 2 family protein [Candidatus Dormibacteraeota bacterium]|nr:nuclear transport factor 2 family protein [Candidatus Dormibacteraeota bacterium]